MPACGVAQCPEPPTLQWQRWATPEELEQLKADGEIGQGETEARLPVFGCDAHKISLELAAPTHDAVCTAPPTCDCSVSDPLPTPHLE